jgi:small-conductance mechanosensitive channel
VTRLTIRHTEIAVAGGALVVVPNSELLSQHLLNETPEGAPGSLQLELKVAPEAEPRRVTELLAAAAAGDPRLAEPPRVLLRAVSDTASEFAIDLRLGDLAQRDQVRHDLLLAIDAALRQEGIARGH